MGLYAIEHVTRQRYREDVRRSRNEVRLQPISGGAQRLVSVEVSVSPDGEMDRDLDYFSNTVWMLAVESPHRELVITCRSEVEVQAPHVDPALDYAWDDDSLALDPTAEFIAPSPRVPRLRGTEDLNQRLGVVARDPRSLLAANERLREHFRYVPGATTVGTRLPEVLEKRVGVCQDFAHVLLAIARHAGWPARYVSGYLLPTAKEVVGESHAWIEVATPGGQWVGLDPTHGLVVTDRHVRVATGRDYDDVAPVRGTFSGQLRGEPPEVVVRIRALEQHGDAVPAYARADQ
ncbi:MAG: transglutaminase family protein [Candidatus Dormibacteria bacterium]